MDLVVGVPYLHVRTKERGSRSSQAGVSDVSVELKWRFFEESGWSLALKPGITIPTGDRDKGLGSGRVSPSLFLITTKEIEAWAFHLNRLSQKRKRCWRKRGPLACLHGL
jgi:hypothetical protein